MLDQGQTPPRRKLKVDLPELEFAFENTSFEATHYLDLETGRVIRITDETRRELEASHEEAWDEEKQEVLPTAFAEALHNLPEWAQEAVQEADQIEAGHGSRFIRVPQADSHEGYRDMEDFICTVENQRLQDRLGRAISGRGAFRYFKDVLLDDPRERERWFKFKDERVRQRVLEWLESEGIEPIEE